MIKRFVIMLAAVAVVFGGIFGWKYYSIQQRAALSNREPPPAVVSSDTVRAEDWRSDLSAVGNLVADQGLSVASEIAGQVESIEFASGQKVEAGDVLVRMDDSVDSARLQGMLAEKRLAELEFNRTADLLEENSVSRSSYDQAQARLQNAKAQIASIRAVLDKKTIRAPFAGSLGVREVNLGEYLAPGAPVVTLQSLDPIHVDFSLPERYISDLAEGLAVDITVQAYPDVVFHGTLTAINPRVDSETRNIRLRATLENPEHRLRPGMYADVRLLLSGERKVLVLNQAAVSFNAYGDFVFRIEEHDGNQVVTRRQVDTGEVRNDQVAIRQGLAAGDQVVLAGQVKLRNGQKVEIDNSVDLDMQVATQ